MVAPKQKSQVLPSAPRNKIVIRRLPPNLPEETFWNTVSPWVNENTCLWKRFVKGASGDRNDGYATLSRAYLLMKDAQSIVELHRGYDGHVFRSKTGQEYQAVVEYAPVQKTPYKAKAKVDSRQGTIDDEPDYLSFLESLKEPAVKPTLESTPAITQPKTTPLLDHLRTHGPKSKKSKTTSTEASSDAVARRATASVSAAAAKRAPGDTGPKLVAGKGREVAVAGGGGGDGHSQGQEGGDYKKKRSRGKKGGDKSEKGEKSDGKVEDKTKRDIKSAAPTTVPAPRQEAPEKKITILPRQPSAQPNGVQKNKPVTLPAQPGPTKAQTGNARPPSPATSDKGKNIGGKGGSQAGRGGRSRGRGGNSGAGGDNKERSAKNTVISILTKNAQGDRGGKAARGGRAPPVIEPGAATARIDG